MSEEECGWTGSDGWVGLDESVKDRRFCVVELLRSWCVVMSVGSQTGVPLLFLGGLKFVAGRRANPVLPLVLYSWLPSNNQGTAVGMLGWGEPNGREGGGGITAADKNPWLEEESEIRSLSQLTAQSLLGEWEEEEESSLFHELKFWRFCPAAIKRSPGDWRLGFWCRSWRRWCWWEENIFGSTTTSPLMSWTWVDGRRWKSDCAVPFPRSLLRRLFWATCVSQEKWFITEETVDFSFVVGWVVCFPPAGRQPWINIYRMQEIWVKKMERNNQTEAAKKWSWGSEV